MHLRALCLHASMDVWNLACRSRGVFSHCLFDENFQTRIPRRALAARWSIMPYEMLLPSSLDNAQIPQRP